MKIYWARCLLLALGCGGFAAEAATISSVVVSPTTARVGEQVTITINGDGDSPNCGIRLQFGDVIPTESFALSDRGTLPLVLTKTFDKPGTVKVEALGRKTGPLTFGCKGDAATTLTVVPASASGAAPAQCPSGWSMITGQKDPGKGYTCAPPRPAPIDCGKNLIYFEKDGLVGCKKRR